jgi:hypothetical protein
MLNQTRYTKEDLIKCGINKKDLRVRTPFDYIHKGWNNPTICIFNSETYCNFKTIRALLRLFNVTIVIKDKKPIHLFVEYNYTKKGKLLIFNSNINEFLKGVRHERD